VDTSLPEAGRSDAEIMLQVKAGDDSAFEYLVQKYRRPMMNFMFRMAHSSAAAEDLAQHDLLERDVFARRVRIPATQVPEGPEGLADVSVFKLIEALDRALQNARPEFGHEVVTDRLSITDAISRVAELLRVRRRISFEELLGAGEGERATRATILATFLALLEMAKLKLVRIFQAPADEAGPGSEIVVEAKDTLGEGPVAATEDYR